MRAISDGVTILQPARGQWISEEGTMIPVRIACTREEMCRIMDMTAHHYRQIAVVASMVASEVIVKEYGTKYANYRARL